MSKLKAAARFLAIPIVVALSACAASQITAEPQRAVQSQTASTPALHLARVVMLMRHGIRPPTQSPETPAGFASDPWPQWGTPYGHLTPHGAEAVKLVGRYERAVYASSGLLPATGCPEGDAVRVWSDSDERTIRTGDVLLDSMFPGCGITNGHLTEGKTDRLFSAIELEGVSMDDAAAHAVIFEHIDSVASVLRIHREELAKLHTVLGCCSVKVCAASGLPAGCNLADLPAGIKSPEKGRPRLSGSIDVASTAAQILMLEYVEGMPMTQVGWGRTNRDDIETIMRLHTLKGDLVQRPLYLSSRGATPLARRMLEALEGIGAPGSNGSKVTVLVGHDTNIVDLGGMLELHWRVDSYPMDNAPPGGALGFELLSDRRGKQFVRAFYRSQTMDQMRELKTLDVAHPPYQQYLTLPGCAHSREEGTLCPLNEFSKLVRSRLVGGSTLTPPAS